MMTEWTGLKVDAKCLDPRPPQMTPPNIFPEGVPFVDARPPQDNSDRLQDDSSLLGGPGNQIVTTGQLVPGASPGALSPQLIIGEPYVANAYTLADDYTIITGLVPAPTQNANNMPPQTNPLK
jgi:hypothetical protein